MRVVAVFGNNLLLLLCRIASEDIALVKFASLRDFLHLRGLPELAKFTDKNAQYTSPEFVGQALDRMAHVHQTRLFNAATADASSIDTRFRSLAGVEGEVRSLRALARTSVLTCCYRRENC